MRVAIFSGNGVPSAHFSWEFFFLGESLEKGVFLENEL